MESIDGVVAKARARTRPAPDLESVAASARRVLQEFLDGEDITPTSIARAKIAAGVVGSHAREIQSQRAYEGVAVMMAREIATNLEERQRYITATLPDHPMVKEMQQGRAIEATK